MKPSPEVEAKGLKAYEQAGAFERLRTWRLPLSYLIFVMIPLVNGIVLLKYQHVAMAWGNFGCALLFACIGWWHWIRLKARYAHNLNVLAEMERLYGEQLPWVQVEKHFAALEELERELAEEGERERNS